MPGLAAAGVHGALSRAAYIPCYIRSLTIREPAPDLSDTPPPASPTSPASGPAGTYLDGLNPEQREAVEATEGPVLVLAGAGTGKTRVLTTRLAHILATGRAEPWELLAVTFTNKAAREMRERIAHHRPLGRGAALAGHLSLGRRPDPAPPRRAGRPEVQLHHHRRRRPGAADQAAAGSREHRPQALDAAPPGRPDRPVEEPRLDAGQAAAGRGRAISPTTRRQALYQMYQDRLRVLNACDFGDLLLHNLTIFTPTPDVLADYHERFRYMLVDEYQDTNVAQYLWLRLLAQGRQNLCCVGDDDQSIYGWRGAEVDNILRFERDFPGAKVIRLERNYRSTDHILAAASGLIAANKGRLGKTLWTEADGGDEGAGARRVGRRGREPAGRRGDRALGKRAGRRYRECAILVRASFQMRAFEERFVHAADPLPGGRRPALLRARRDPRRPRLPAAGAVARTTTWLSSASSTRPSAASATPRCRRCCSWRR